MDVEYTERQSRVMNSGQPWTSSRQPPSCFCGRGRNTGPHNTGMAGKPGTMKGYKAPPGGALICVIADEVRAVGLLGFLSCVYFSLLRG
jgi:hypothetical protein